jgi:hypothetical protein
MSKIDNEYILEEMVQSEIRNRFMDLTLMVYGINDRNPAIIARLLYELINEKNNFPKDYIPDDQDMCETMEIVEKMLFDIERLSETSTH